MAGRRIADLHAALSWDLDDFDRGTSHIEAGFSRLRSMITGIGDAFVAQGKRMTLGITVPSAAFALFVTKVASDAQELESAFNYSFGAMSKRMDKWADDTGDSLGRATTEMKQGALAFNQLFGPAAQTADDAAKLSQQFTELAQNAASFFNTDFDTALGKLRSGLSGEAEPLRDFGVFLNEAAVKNKALEMGLIKTGQELTEYGKIMARAALITENMTQVNGDIGRTGDELANMWRALVSDLRELAEYMGQKFMPYAKAMIAWAQSAVKWFKDLPEPVHNFIVVMGVAAAAMGPLILAMTTLAVILLPLFVARFGPVLLVLSALINPIGTAIVYLLNFGKTWAAITALVSRLAPILLGLLSPLGLLLAAFTALGVALWYFSDAGENAGRSLDELESSASEAEATAELMESRLKAAGIMVDKVGSSSASAKKDVDSLADSFKAAADRAEELAEKSGLAAIRMAQLKIIKAQQERAPIEKILADREKAFPNRGKGTPVDMQIEKNRAQIDALKTEEAAYRRQIIAISTAPKIALGGTTDSNEKSYAAPGSDPKSKRAGRGRTGPTAEELSDRREEIRLAQQLAIAQQKGNVEAERSVQRQIDLRRKVADYVNAGLSKQAAAVAAEKDMLELDEARAIASAKRLDSDERSFDMQIAEIRNDHAQLKFLQDQEFIEAEILRMTKEGISLHDAEIEAQNKLLVLETARTEQMARRLADEEREHQIELARIRGDDPKRIYQMQDALRRDDRIAELRKGGLSEADAIAQATQEGMDRSRAHLQGTFRDTFRNGLRAAMDGNLGDFIKNFWKDKMFDVFSRVLDRFADNLANLMSSGGGGGGGGLFSAIGNILGGGGGGFDLSFLGGNSSSAMGAQSLRSLSVPGFANSGSFKIKGFSGVDKNLLSLNGNPIARVSSGEIMDVRQGSSGGSEGGIVEIRLKDEMLDARIISGSVSVVREAAPQIRDSAVNEAFRQSGRPKL